MSHTSCRPAADTVFDLAVIIDTIPPKTQNVGLSIQKL